MQVFDTAHLIYLGSTIIFLIILGIIVRHSNRLVQNIIFILITIVCCGGIFYRYGINFGKSDTILWATLGKQLLQVCNFNFILLPLMLIPKNRLARQYSMMFSMFAAMTTFTSISSSWKDISPLDPIIWNSWLNHVMAVALPLMMIVARKEKPLKEYCFKVLLLVFLYFTASYLIQEAMVHNGIDIGDGWSFIYDPMGAPILKQLYDLIKVPYFYLFPMIPLLYLFFRFLCFCFKKYKVD